MMVRLLSAALVAGALLADTPPEVRAMVKKSLEGLNKEDGAKSEYLYTVLNEKKEFDSGGKTVTASSTKWRREMQGKYTVGRVVERDGKPIGEKERTDQEARIAKAVAEWDAAQGRPPAQRKPATKKSSEDEWLQEFPEALDYKQVGEEKVNGRDAIILDFAPRPGYSPKSMRSRIFEKMRGRMWIDKLDHEMVKADAEMFDTVHIGFGVLGRIAKGTQFSLSRVKLTGGHWVIDWQRFRFDARIMLVKNMRMEQSARYTDFQPRPTPASTGRAAQK